MTRHTVKPTRRPRYGLLRVLAPLLLFVFGCFTPAPPPSAISPGEAGVAILGQVQQLAPGSQAAFLVQAREPYSATRRAGVPIEVYLNGPEGASRQVFAGVTGADGIVAVRFPVPADLSAPEQVLEVRAARGEGGDSYRAFQDVYVGRTWNVLVTTDKPVYQPGQVVHVRGLALDTLDLRAANGVTMTLSVADPQGNKLLQEEIATSEYGITSLDFPLAAEAPSGDYTITAALGAAAVGSAATGSAAGSATVEVKPYTLPRFEVTFAPERTFYLPGEIATGTVAARYFFGKPLAGAQVSIRGTLDDGSGAQTVVELGGVTGDDGQFVYTFLVPADLAGQLDNQSIDIELEIRVSDTAGHTETIEDSVTAAEKNLLIEAVPEAGTLRPGLDNVVYLSAKYPDGVAAQAQLTVTDALSRTFGAVTDPYGQAAITLPAPADGLVPLLVTANDGRGNMVEQPLLLAAETPAAAAVLLRPSQAEYKVGDTLHIDIYVADLAAELGTLPGHGVDTVYLDIIKDRQSFGMAPLPLRNGLARAAVALDGSLLGSLEINAYVVDAYGQIARDRRYVLVNPAPAEVSVRADKEEYRPGDTATLDIAVTRHGQPHQAAIGLSIVDESVYAVDGASAGDPTFARTYFLLNRQLQKPHYGIHSFVDLKSDDPSPYDTVPDSVRYAQGSARQLALAGAFAELLAEETQTHAGLAAAQAAGPLKLAHAPGPWAPAGPLASAWGARLFLVAPLLGLAFYDGSRSRRRLLIGLVVFSLGAFVWGACAAPGAAPAAQTAPMAQAGGAPGAAPGEKPPRLRQFFPETMYWLPEVVTDEQGRAQIEAPVADTITTWRATLLVSDRQGNLGSAELPLKVFQDFFVEPDLPRFLTVGDEIDIPVAIYNYLSVPQVITLEVAPGDWFELRGKPQLQLAAGANEVLAAYVPIRVTQFGDHHLQITARGANQSDAVVRPLTVLPDGERVTDSRGGRLEPGAGAEQAIALPVPTAAISGTGRVTVKLYPSIVSQMIGGLEGMLQMPYGCFEQASSVTYPNVLVLDYLRRTGQASGGVEMQAEYLVGMGYQRLIGFEVPGEPGGFSLFGDPPADPGLTAYGLQEFGDMARVAYVDPALLDRMVEYLADRQNRNGSWEGAMPDALANTAYVAWGMADAGYAGHPAVRKAVRYIERSLDRQEITDSYTLGLAANALLASGADAAAPIEQLLAKAQRAGEAVYWLPEGETYFGSHGLPGTVEVTAIAAQALLRSESSPEMAQGALVYLAASRDANGSFYTTQATVQALKALLLGLEDAGSDQPATVAVTLTGAGGAVQSQTLVVDPNSNVVQTASFAGVAPGARLALAVDGGRPLQYQVVTEYYQPWDTVAARPAGGAGAAAGSTDEPASGAASTPLRLAVSYDRNRLQVDEMLHVSAAVELRNGAAATTLIVELGLPPGFVPISADLEALVENGRIERYELTGRSIVLYLTEVAGGEVYHLDYRLQARLPVTAQSAGSQAYDYYAPEQRVSAAPQHVTVAPGLP